jgi:hypothetical protein
LQKLQEIYNGQTIYRSFSANHYYLTNFLLPKNDHDFYIDIGNWKMLDRRDQMRFVQGPNGAKIYSDE